MRTFDQLTPNEQAAADVMAMKRLLERICEGRIRFLDRAAQLKVNQAAKKANDNGTPWFMHEYVMDALADELRPLAQQWSRTAHYKDPGDLVLELAA